MADNKNTYVVSVMGCTKWLVRKPGNRIGLGYRSEASLFSADEIRGTVGQFGGLPITEDEYRRQIAAR